MSNLTEYEKEQAEIRARNYFFMKDLEEKSAEDNREKKLKANKYYIEDVGTAYCVFEQEYRKDGCGNYNLIAQKLGEFDTLKAAETSIKRKAAHIITKYNDKGEKVE